MRSHFHTPLHFRTVDDLKLISAEINARPAARPADPGTPCGGKIAGAPGRDP